MRLLLDTHALLWALSDPERLGERARPAIESPENSVFVSAVSALEIAIKQSLSKLELPGLAEEWLLPAVEEAGIEWLPLTPVDAVRTRALPWHHRDPFDRVLVAQAARGFILVTGDLLIPKYNVPVLWD